MPKSLVDTKNLTPQQVKNGQEHQKRLAERLKLLPILMKQGIKKPKDKRK